jgi:hypothetical protein
MLAPSLAAECGVTNVTAVVPDSIAVPTRYLLELALSYCCAELVAVYSHSANRSVITATTGYVRFRLGALVMHQRD